MSYHGPAGPECTTPRRERVAVQPTSGRHVPPSTSARSATARFLLLGLVVAALPLLPRTAQAQGRGPGSGLDSLAVITTTQGTVYTGWIMGRDTDSLRLLTLDMTTIAFAHKRIRSIGMRADDARSAGDSLAMVTMRSGSVFIGRIIRRSADSLTVITADGLVVSTALAMVESIGMRPVASMRAGEYWFENPNRTRYLLGSSAFGLRAGEGYYLNTWVLVNSFAVGITDNISIGGGFEILTLTSGDPVYFLTPRVAFPVGDNLALSAGYLYVNAANEDFAGLSIAYGVATVGNSDNNLSCGMGFGSVDGTWSKDPVLTFSGMLRTSRRFGLVTENWVITGDDVTGIFSYGVRFIGETITVDVAFLNNADIAKTFALGVPWLDMMVRF
jgi:hypothetical protein